MNAQDNELTLSIVKHIRENKCELIKNFDHFSLHYLDIYMFKVFYKNIEITMLVNFSEIYFECVHEAGTGLFNKTAIPSPEGYLRSEFASRLTSWLIAS